MLLNYMLMNDCVLVVRFVEVGVLMKIIDLLGLMLVMLFRGMEMVNEFELLFIV